MLVDFVTITFTTSIDTGTVGVITVTTNQASYTSTATVYTGCAINNFNSTYGGRFFGNALDAWTNIPSTLAKAS